jgi:hypothetical protein
MNKTVHDSFVPKGSINETEIDIQSRIWLHFYRNEIFHLKSLSIKKKLVNKACQILNLSRLGLSNVIRQKCELYSDSKKKEYYVSAVGFDRKRIRGAALHFLLKITKTTLSEIQPFLSHLGSGRLGRGIIRNPQFPPIEPLRTRLLATMLSDGHLTARGQLQYFESDPERIATVIEQVNQLGDVDYQIKPLRTKLMRINFPQIIGRLLRTWGMPTGDKTLQQIHLPNYLLQGPPFLKRAYFSEMIPEDGCFSIKKDGRQGVFEWSRSLVLYDPNKARRYGFNQKLTEKHLEFIRKFGQKRLRFGTRSVIELNWTKLKQLESSRELKISVIAQDLMSIIKMNPHTLLEDEIQIAQSLGIQLIEYFSKISLFEKTGRVSAVWSASTSGMENTIRLGLLAPPNCGRKSYAFTEWLLRQPKEHIQNAIGEMYLEAYGTNHKEKIRQP